MEAIITWASGRDSRAESKNRFFFFLCVAIPVIFFMWKNPNNAHSVVYLSQGMERCLIQPTLGVSCFSYMMKSFW